jgi:hypothetical protein
MALADMFGGAQTTNGTSSAEAITAGDYLLVVQGTMDGAVVYIEGNVFDSNYDTLDGQLDMDSTGFRVFRMCAGNVKATVKNAGAATSVKVGILPSA